VLKALAIAHREGIVPPHLFSLLGVHRLVAEINFNLLASFAEQLCRPGCVSQGDHSLQIGETARGAGSRTK
jgi:hypothetical protein